MIRNFTPIPGFKDYFADKLEDISNLLEEREILREALSELVDIWNDPDWRSQIDSFTIQPAKQALSWSPKDSK